MVYFSVIIPPMNDFTILLGAVMIMGLSVSLALLLTFGFDVEGTARRVVLISAIAPSGALTVPFSVEHDLDIEYASALVAATMFFAILLVPILIAL